MAALQRARYPADRLLPMPDTIHPDWTAEEIEQVRTHSARLAVAEGNTTLANNWRLRLRDPRGQFWMRMDARERVTAGAERRAALRAGKDVDPGLTFRTAGLEAFPPPAKKPAPQQGKGKRRRAASDASLSDRMRAGYCAMAVSWDDPSIPPPSGLPRDVWAFAVPLDEDFDAVMRTFAPETVPGSGWSHAKSVRTGPGAKWSEEAKARVRRRNLRNRLDKKVPLFAEMLYAQELAQRTDYFAGQPVAAEQIAQPSVAPVDTLIGHNGGPALDP